MAKRVSWRHKAKRSKKLRRLVQQENAAKCKPGRVIYSRDSQPAP